MNTRAPAATQCPGISARPKLGILVGKRTWGGLVGFHGPSESLMDGGIVTTPSRGFWTPNNDWEVENHGVAPDVEVELDPKAVREGHDPQLERTVELLLADLEKNPIPKQKKPPYPTTVGRRSTGNIARHVSNQCLWPKCLIILASDHAN